PSVLDFPFQNWSDTVEPLPDATTVVRGDGGQPLTIAREGITPHSWRSIFHSFPVETLPPSERGEALLAGIGWLSPLGKSSWSVTPATPQPGENLKISLTLYNDADEAHEVAITHTMPSSIRPVLSTLPPETSYETSTQQIRWTGTVSPTRPLTLQWEAYLEPTAQIGEQLTPTVEIEISDWGLAFSRSAALRIAGANLGASAWVSSTGEVLQPREPTTLTFALRNTGPGDVEAGTAQIWLMPELAPITATLPPTRGTSLTLWEGGLPSGVTRTFSIAVRPWKGNGPVRVDALLDDGTGQRWTRSLWLEVPPWQLYMPIITRGVEH
ncbi:MAG: hypothetical protein ACP5GX_12640, partial [Anaerolineae bacterium]